MSEQKRTVTVREVRKNLKAILQQKNATIIGHESWGTIQDVRAIIVPVLAKRWGLPEGRGPRAEIAEARRQAAKALKLVATIRSN